MGSWAEQRWILASGPSLPVWMDSSLHHPASCLFLRSLLRYHLSTQGPLGTGPPEHPSSIPSDSRLLPGTSVVKVPFYLFTGKCTEGLLCWLLSIQHGDWHQTQRVPSGPLSDSFRWPKDSSFQQREFHAEASYCIWGNPRPLYGHSMSNKFILKETKWQWRQGAGTIEGERG